MPEGTPGNHKISFNDFLRTSLKQPSPITDRETKNRSRDKKEEELVQQVAKKQNELSLMAKKNKQQLTDKTKAVLQLKKQLKQVDEDLSSFQA